jgi:hypothetical protein
MKSFKAFRLDTANHLLWRDGDRVSLTPKSFDVLAYLVEHVGRVVTQDEILEALWVRDLCESRGSQKEHSGNPEGSARPARQPRIQLKRYPSAGTDLLRPLQMRMRPSQTCPRHSQGKGGPEKRPLKPKRLL